MAAIHSCDKCGALFNPKFGYQHIHIVNFSPSPVSGEPAMSGVTERSDMEMELCLACSFNPNAAPVQPMLTEVTDTVEYEDQDVN